MKLDNVLVQFVDCPLIDRCGSMSDDFRTDAIHRKCHYSLDVAQTIFKFIRIVDLKIF